MERDARTHRPLRHRILLPVLALALASCAGPAKRTTEPPRPPTPPTARPHPGYDGRIDSLDVMDPSVLHGKRIVIDPGHGGFFRGSLGVQGLTEAAVNLDVSLELARMLEARGALVLLTRPDNRDFLTPADSALRADLTERTRIANEFRPDFFVSVHHNADPAGARDKNEIQTYYKLGDEGPSLDAAASLNRYLKRNLGIERSRILAGNYFVLRNSVAPAVLTEASYLTNPDVEARLSQPRSRRLEAEAIYLGLVHYFSRRTPVIESFVARAPALSPDTLFREIDGPTIEARIRGGFDRASLEIDGEPAPLIERGATLRWQPSRPLPPGRHEARLRVALSGVGSAPEQRLAFTIARRPASLRVSVTPEGPWPVRALRVELLDRAGLASHDSVGLVVRATRSGVSPAETTVFARDGVAWAYLRLPSSESSGTIARVSLRGGSGPKATATLPASPRPSPQWAGWALRMPEGRPLRGAAQTREPSPGVRWMNRDGFAVVERDSSPGAAAPRLPGYRAWAADAAFPPRWTAIAQGALHGRRILLDPDGGGEESGGMGRSGTRAAFFNMDVAQALASYLTAAGAEVALARTGDYAASDVERVRIGERFGAERYLRIGHRPEGPHAGHYFSSAAGKRWAQRTVGWLTRLGFPAIPVNENAQYPLQQSSCPALYVATGRVDDPAAEERMMSPGAARAEAYALFLGLAAEWSEATWATDSLLVKGAGGEEAAGALVTLGGALVLQADERGVLRFVRTEAGPIEARVDHPAVSSRLVLLDSQRGVVVTGPQGR